MSKYINTKNEWGIETVEEFEPSTTYKERKRVLKEYNLSDPYNSYYFSQCCTKDWNN